MKGRITPGSLRKALIARGVRPDDVRNIIAEAKKLKKVPQPMAKLPKNAMTRLLTMLGKPLSVAVVARGRKGVRVFSIDGYNQLKKSGTRQAAYLREKNKTAKEVLAEVIPETVPATTGALASV